VSCIQQEEKKKRRKPFLIVITRKPRMACCSGSREKTTFHYRLKGGKWRNRAPFSCLRKDGSVALSGAAARKRDRLRAVLPEKGGKKPGPSLRDVKGDKVAVIRGRRVADPLPKTL